MKTWRGPARIFGAALLATGAWLAAPAVAQPNGGSDQGDLQSRVEHLERDMRDLQQEVYRNGGGTRDSGPPPAGEAPASQRVADIEASLHNLTGQLEDLSHRVNDLAAKVQQLENDMNYHFNNGQGGEGAAPPAGGGAEGQPPLAPGPSNLGTVPENEMNAPSRPAQQQPGAANQHVTLTPPQNAAPVATTGSGGDAATKYNAAMDLLARGSYDQARSAFRAIADQYPKHQLAPEALYWAGDISFSAKKDYADAAHSFAELLKKYAKAPHAPDGMLKLGESLLSLGQKQEGCATLVAFPAKYPTASKTLLGKARTDAKKAGCK